MKRVVLGTLVLTALSGCDDPTQPTAIAPLGTVPTATASAAVQQFAVRFLPRSLVLPAAINEQGDVVGMKQFPTGEVHAGLWRAGQGVRDLGTLGGPQSQALDINDRGEVVGLSCTRPACDELRPFLWSESRGMRALGTFGGELGAGVAINNRREVVGDSQDATAHSARSSGVPGVGYRAWAPWAGRTAAPPT